VCVHVCVYLYGTAHTLLYTTLHNDDCSVDDSKTELENIKRCVFSPLVLQRHVFIKRVVACAAEIGVEQTVAELVPLLPKLTEDEHLTIRQGVARMLGRLGLFLATHEDPGELDAEAFLEECGPFPAWEAVMEMERVSSSRLNSPSSATSTDPSTQATQSSSSVAAVQFIGGSDNSANNPSSSSPSSPGERTRGDATASDSNSGSNPSIQSPTSPMSALSRQLLDHKRSSAAATASSTSASVGGASSSTSSLHVAAPQQQQQQQQHAPVSRLGYDCAVKTIIPVLEALLRDSCHEVRIAAEDGLCEVARVLSERDIGKHILTLVLKLVHNESEEEQRILAFHFMDRLAPTFGAENCRGFIAMELAAKTDDERSYRPLKNMASCFGSICAVVGGPFMEQRLLPHFRKLSKNLMWGIRKGCVESLVKICSVASLEVKRDVLIPLLVGFHKDVTRWVRKQAYKELGPFLYELRNEPELISTALVHSFAMIPTFSSNDPAIDAEVCKSCAYSFPAVCLVVGPERWDELHKCYVMLSQNKEHPIRRALAASIHEIAKILGPELTERDLFPIATRFANDVDKVKSMVVRNLGQFALCLPRDADALHAHSSGPTSPSDSNSHSMQQQQQQRGEPRPPSPRMQVLRVIQECQKQIPSWRLRRHISAQFESLCLAYDAKVTMDAMLHVIFELLMDDVSLVREVAAAHVGFLLLRLSVFETMPYLDSGDPRKQVLHGEQLSLWLGVCNNITELVKSPTYNDRQLFIRIACGAVVLCDSEAFFTHFFEVLEALVDDPVVNVRLLLAEAVHLCAHVLRERARQSTDAYHCTAQEGKLELAVQMKSRLDVMREHLSRDPVADVRQRAAIDRKAREGAQPGGLLQHSWLAAKDQMARRNAIVNAFQGRAEADFRLFELDLQRVASVRSSRASSRVHALQPSGDGAGGAMSEGGVESNIRFEDDLEVAEAALSLAVDIPHIHTVDTKANQQQQLEHSSIGGSASPMMPRDSAPPGFALNLAGLSAGDADADAKVDDSGAALPPPLAYERQATPRNPYDAQDGGGVPLCMDSKAEEGDWGGEFELDEEERAALALSLAHDTHTDLHEEGDMSPPSFASAEDDDNGVQVVGDVNLSPTEDFDNHNDNDNDDDDDDDEGRFDLNELGGGDEGVHAEGVSVSVSESEGVQA
jgi:hypothetical protein